MISSARPVKALVALSLGLLTVVGCASIMKGTKQSISLNSTPAAAKVVIKTTGGVQVWEGTTPATVKLSKKKEYIATVSLEGYQDATANISKDGIEGWFWGNLICGGVIGIIVDATNGAMSKLEPDEISVELRTAMLPGGEEQLYAIFRGLDSRGQMRTFSVPILRSGSTAEISSLD